MLKIWAVEAKKSLDPIHSMWLVSGQQAKLSFLLLALVSHIKGFVSYLWKIPSRATGDNALSTTFKKKLNYV